jgi:hypothetical protein
MLDVADFAPNPAAAELGGRISARPGR